MLVATSSSLRRFLQLYALHREQGRVAELEPAARRVVAAFPTYRHLAMTIRTGVFCSYGPDPRAPVSWQT